MAPSSGATIRAEGVNPVCDPPDLQSPQRNTGARFHHCTQSSSIPDEIITVQERIGVGGVSKTDIEHDCLVSFLANTCDSIQVQGESTCRTT